VTVEHRSWGSLTSDPTELAGWFASAVAARHSFSTLLGQHGVTHETVSQQHGQADLALTASIYSHVSMQMQESAAEILERVMVAARSESAVLEWQVDIKSGKVAGGRGGCCRNCCQSQ
jgi:hypothetical protein